jgi:hypothetical protein
MPQTEEARRAYRELIVTMPGLGESISGVILYDETSRIHYKSSQRRFVTANWRFRHSANRKGISCETPCVFQYSRRFSL